MMLHRVGCRERTQFSFIQQTLHFTFWFKHSIWWYCHRRVGFVEGFSKIISMFILYVLMQLGPYLGWWAQRPNGLWPQNQGDFKPQCNRTFSGQAKKNLFQALAILNATSKLHLIWSVNGFFKLRSRLSWLFQTTFNLCLLYLCKFVALIRYNSRVSPANFKVKIWILVNMCVAMRKKKRLQKQEMLGQAVPWLHNCTYLALFKTCKSIQSFL